MSGKGAGFQIPEDNEIERSKKSQPWKDPVQGIPLVSLKTENP